MLNADEKKRLKLLQAKIDAARDGAAAVELTEDDERFLDLVALKSSRQNVRKKALSGKPLTSREAAMLSESLGDDAPAAGVTFAKNWNELADAIPIDRRTLQNFRHEHAELIRDQRRTLEKADGRKDVLEWRTLIAECGVKGRGVNNTDPAMLDVRQLELAERHYKLERAKFAFEKEKDAMLAVAQFERALAKTMAAFLASLNAFGPRVNEMLEGLDFDGRAVVLETEIEIIRKSLATCDYLTTDEGDDDGA